MYRMLMIGVLALTTTGCSDDPRTAIVGSWRGETLAQDMQFFSDGRALLDDRKHGKYDGTCQVTDGNQLTCHFGGFSLPVVRTVHVRGDELVLTTNGGREEVFRRGS